MKYVTVILHISILIFVSACASSSGRSDSSMDSMQLLEREISQLIVKPTLYQRKLIATQQVSIDFSGTQFEFLAQIELTRDKLIFAAVNALGQKLFHIIQTGEQYSFARHFPEIELKPEYLLSDLALSYVPTDILRKHILEKRLNIVLVEAHQQRQLQSDHINIQINYSHQDPWQGEIEYTNNTAGYTLHIKTVSIEKLN